ncbi:hypothetical protein ISCGN_008140 [Ixodes scapularis]
MATGTLKKDGWQLHTIVTVVLVPLACCAEFTITLLHTNDVHSRFEEFLPSGTRCPQSSAKLGLCVGGIARQKTLVNQVRSTEQHVLFLNAGDYYQGTLWYYLLGAKIVVEAVNYLGHDAMSLGNHEFDRGPEGLAPLLRDSKVPILGCNVDFTEEPSLKNLSLKASMTVRFGSQLVGIIGYLTLKSVLITKAPRVRFTNETDCIKREAVQLRQQGANVIIAVGHSGLDNDKEIARAIPEISVVVGGRSHLLLYSGHTVNGRVSGDLPGDSYPVVVKREDGSRCLIVHDFWMGKYMGNLTITWDDHGQPLRWRGQPTLLDNSVEQDPAGLALLDKYRPQLQAARSRIVAATYVYLQADRKTLRFGESNMGNVMAEAFLKYLAKRMPRRSGFWSSVSAVIINSGSLRTSILEGIITFEDVVNVLPFGDSISLVNMTGAQLKGVLEHGVRRYDVKGVKKRGEFLQMAGMRVVYNVYREPRHRVIDLQILCTACRVPRFERVKDDRIYSIGTAKYIAHGGDEFNFSFLKPRDHVDTSFLAVEVAAEYLNASSPVTMGLDGRIAFVKGACVKSFSLQSLAFLHCSLFVLSQVFSQGGAWC